MFAKTFVRKLTRRNWVPLSICAVIALAGIVVGYINDLTNGTAGTDSIVERIKQDGTLAHPYADASQLPTQHRHSYLAGRVALDPEHPS